MDSTDLEGGEPEALDSPIARKLEKAREFGVRILGLHKVDVDLLSSRERDRRSAEAEEKDAFLQGSSARDGIDMIPDEIDFNSPSAGAHDIHLADSRRVGSPREPSWRPHRLEMIVPAT